MDAIIEILKQALCDASLDQMVIRVHQAFFQAEAGPQSTPQETAPYQPGLPAQEPATLRSQIRQMEQGAWWIQMLAALVLVCILVGSPVTLQAIRQAPGSAGQPGRTGHPHALTCTAGSWSDEIDTQQQGALAGVAAISPTHVRAVGTLFAVNDEHRNAGLIEHWDGQRWSVVPSPDALPVGRAQNKLLAITAIAANDIRAVGEVQGLPSGRWTLIEHWDGQHWQLVPDQGNQFQKGTLLSVIAFSAGNVRVAGNALIVGGPMPTSELLEHWDGRRWQATISAPGLTIVSRSALSSTDIRDVGNVGNAQGQMAISGILCRESSPALIHPRRASRRSLQSMTTMSGWPVGQSRARCLWFIGMDIAGPWLRCPGRRTVQAMHMAWPPRTIPSGSWVWPQNTAAPHGHCLNSNSAAGRRRPRPVTAKAPGNEPLACVVPAVPPGSNPRVGGLYSLRAEMEGFKCTSVFCLPASCS